jgi:hypothetical protein
VVLTFYTYYQFGKKENIWGFGRHLILLNNFGTHDWITIPISSSLWFGLHYKGLISEVVILASERKSCLGLHVSILPISGCPVLGKD